MEITVFCVAVVLAVIFAGPLDKTQVILMPDTDGHVGQAEVITEGGSQLLTEPGQMTIVIDGSKPPSDVAIVDQEEIAEDFSEVLAIEPVLPEKFLLYFLPGSNDLTKDSIELLPKVVDTIKERKSSYISIFGHSDRVGAEEYNLQLSTNRAIAVRQLLEELGVSSANIETDSHGEGNPLVKTADGVAESQNRRVEVIIR